MIKRPILIFSPQGKLLKLIMDFNFFEWNIDCRCRYRVALTYENQRYQKLMSA